MKKLLLTLGLMAVASAAFAQGTLAVQNSATTRMFINSVATNGSFARTPASTTTLYYWEVLNAPSTVTTIDVSLQQLLGGQWSDTGAQMTNSGATGLMGGSTAAANGAAVLNNWGAGVTNSFIVVGWSSEEGSTWASVAAKLAGATLTPSGGTNGVWTGGGLVAGGFLGATVIGTAVPSPTTSPAALIFSATTSAQVTPITGTTQLFVVGSSIVPEPSTFALVGLGVASMVIFRRRK